MQCPGRRAPAAAQRGRAHQSVGKHTGGEVPGIWWERTEATDTAAGNLRVGAATVTTTQRR